MKNEFLDANGTSDFLGNTSKRLLQPSFAVSVVSYHEKVSEDWHYHENVHLSSILLGGNRESRKNQDLMVVPGKIMCYQEGEIHRNRHTAHPSLNLNIELFPGFFDEDIALSQLKHEGQSYLSTLKIYNELFINDTYSSESINQLIKALFYPIPRTRIPNWIDELKSLLNDRWDEFISLEEISNELGLHPVSISKGFAKYTGTTLADYMRMLKINRAVDLVLNSSLSMTEIAYDCGFSDQSHMYRLFKSYTHFSPKLLRKIREM